MSIDSCIDAGQYYYNLDQRNRRQETRDVALVCDAAGARSRDLNFYPWQ
jgi:hypothetical protein